jgi:hypothetical protein
MVNTKKEFPRGISDQVISSPDSREVVDSVHPGPGLKLQAREDSTVNRVAEPQASSTKHQAFEPTWSSFKRQASKPQAQGSSVKPQATSSVILDPWNMDIGEVLGGKGPRAFTMINVLSG